MLAITTTARTAVAALALTLAACVSSPELESARAEEVRAETLIESIEALPDDTPGKAKLLADAIEAERTLEAQRKALEALSQDGLIGTGLEIGADAAKGDYIGALEALGGLGIAAATYWLTRKRTKVDLAALEARRDSSRAVQGIAPSTARSAELAGSAVALAAHRERQQQTMDAVAAILNRTPQAAPPYATAPPAYPSAAPGDAPHSSQAAPPPPAATYYGDPGRFPGPGVG